MTVTVYNTLYDNGAYNRMALAIADHMGVNYDSPSQDYLDVMMEIQDKALYYAARFAYCSSLTSLRICYHKDIYPFYLDFMEPFARYYRKEFDLF